MYKNYQSFNCKTIITKRTGKYKEKERKINKIYPSETIELRNIFVKEEKNKQGF